MKEALLARQRTSGSKGDQQPGHQGTGCGRESGGGRLSTLQASSGSAARTLEDLQRRYDQLQLKHTRLLESQKHASRSARKMTCSVDNHVNNTHNVPSAGGYTSPDLLTGSTGSSSGPGIATSSSSKDAATASGGNATSSSSSKDAGGVPSSRASSNGTSTCGSAIKTEGGAASQYYYATSARGSDVPPSESGGTVGSTPGVASVAALSEGFTPPPKASPGPRSAGARSVGSRSGNPRKPLLVPSGVGGAARQSEKKSASRNNFRPAGRGGTNPSGANPSGTSNITTSGADSAISLAANMRRKLLNQNLGDEELALMAKRCTESWNLKRGVGR